MFSFFLIFIRAMEEGVLVNFVCLKKTRVARSLSRRAMSGARLAACFYFPTTQSIYSGDLNRYGSAD